MLSFIQRHVGDMGEYSACTQESLINYSPHNQDGARAYKSTFKTSRAGLPEKLTDEDKQNLIDLTVQNSHIEYMGLRMQSTIELLSALYRTCFNKSIKGNGSSVGDLRIFL
jgi:hypothetical protein